MTKDHVASFSWPVVDVGELRRYRSDRLAEFMREVDVDALLLTTFDGIRYATDFRTQLISEGFDWFAACVFRDGDSAVFVPYIDEAERSSDVSGAPRLLPVPSWAPSAGHPRVWVSAIAEQLAGAGVRRLGCESIPMHLLEGLRQWSSAVEFVDVAHELLCLRLIKHATEIQLLEAASAANSQAIDAALSAVEPGMIDYEVLAVAMASLQRSGVEYLTHSLCNAMNGRDWFARGLTLRAGGTFFLDIGCYGRGGYASDMCRTGFVGDPSPKVRHAYELLLEAHAAAQEVARPGIRSSHVHRVANSVLQSAGLPRTPYAVGHGVGLRACELPTIYRPDMTDEDFTLEEQMTIAIEPETAVEVGGELVVMKVEDVFVVESHGLRRLTSAAY
jgi:Xaa-Pro aminopeptidase